MEITTIEAPGAFTVRGIAPFAEQLCASIDEADAIALDLSACEEADLGALQLVTAAREYAVGKGKQFRLSEPAGEALQQVLERAGFLTEITSSDIDFWFHGASPQ